MEDMSRRQLGELADKYKQEIELQLGHEVPREKQIIYSREYQQFKREILPAHYSLYEKLCKLFDKIGIQPDKKHAEELTKSIETCHLSITPAGAYSFAIFLPLLVMILGFLIFFVALNNLFFTAFAVLFGAVLMIPLFKLPHFLASNWRIRASNQMVLCIFYVVTFMRHTSNLENAIEFAAEHLGPPLSLDLKKVLWDVETEEYSGIKESLDNYLLKWRGTNNEFVEAFELVESSLYEGSEERRLAVLDKSLEVILSETYEKMLHYAHNLKSPITMLHMLGIIMPILGLVILPLVVSFMGDSAKWYHIAAIYNLLIPGAVFYMGKVILAKRPTGYGDTDIAQMNPHLKKYRNVIIKFFGMELKINPLFIAIAVFVVLFLIGLSPVIIHTLYPDYDIVMYGKNNELSLLKDVDERDLNTINYAFIDYKEAQTEDETTGEKPIIGPFGIGASVLSVFLVLAFGWSLGIYYKLRSKNVIEIRKKSKELEKEFASAIFQLGNRLGDGLPAELAFERVSRGMGDSISGKFFDLVSNNIRRLGMSVQQAIFDKKIGALLAFPSNLIESSMKVLIQSVQKGPRIAAQSLMNIARYIKEIHKVDERLKDLLGEIISSMKSQIAFLTPAIAGIVIGITSMISTILGKLGILIKQAESEGEGAATIPPIFGDGIPTYYFMIIVGFYVVQIVYILTALSNGIENGEDKLNERYQLGINLIKSTTLFCFISIVVMILFNIIATTIISSTLSM